MVAVVDVAVAVVVARYAAAVLLPYLLLLLLLLPSLLLLLPIPFLLDMISKPVAFITNSCAIQQYQPVHQ